MNTRQAKQTAREWVAANLDQWPGLRAAHLVGSITTMPDDAHFPSHKDVDLHLIFDPDSPLLIPTGPFPTMIEVAHDGLLIEAGLKSVEEYRSAEAVLANPEIAHHLTVDSTVYDPSGLLRGLREPVRRAFAHPHWTARRLAHERAGLAGALGMLPMARAMAGASGEALVLGYTSTFVAAALCVATLRPPTTGSRAILAVRSILAEHGRPDLYEAYTAAHGLHGATPDNVAQRLQEGAEAFDLAVTVRRSPHPFQHKLHPHLRPYFVESCRSLIAEGHDREALHWLTPFYHASTDIIRADGPDAERAAFSARHAGFLADLGLGTETERTARIDQVRQISESILALADTIVPRQTDAAA
ncbi:MAG: hypothetical protein AB7R89_05710 [Dehalococcoidia bacterium]